MKLSFNVNRLIEMWLSELDRKPKRLAWLQSGLKPLTSLWGLFLAFRTEMLYEATITGETNRLEKALQDKYGNPGIYIIQPTDYLDDAWIWKETEPHFAEYDHLESENHEPAEYDYLESEFDPDYDFVIRVPSALAMQVQVMREFLKKYVMAGKRYNIELY